MATARVRVSPHMHSMCTSYVLLYCVYALVGGAISIRDPYICAVHESVPTNRTLSSTGQLSGSENVAIGFKTSIEAYFVEEKKQRYDAELLVVHFCNLFNNFSRSINKYRGDYGRPTEAV